MALLYCAILQDVRLLYRRVDCRPEYCEYMSAMKQLK